ncbi:MAG: DUF4097 family beta strand repeat-containing protein [Vulcanimicrobiaceae bacterium]
MQRYLLIPSLMVVLLGASGWTSVSKTTTQSSVGITAIHVITTNGRVTVDASSSNMITINEKRSAPSGDIDRWTTQFSRHGSTLIITAHYDGHCWWTCGGIAYALSMPSSLAPTMQTTNGSIKVSGISADIRAETTNGHVTVRGAHSNVWLTTTNGGVDVSFVPGANARNASLETTNGGLNVRLAGQPLAQLDASVTNGSISNDLGIKTGKDVHLTWPVSGLKLRMDTTNGSISIQK